jgi:hypothetical protein
MANNCRKAVQVVAPIDAAEKCSVCSAVSLLGDFFGKKLNA